MFFLSFEPLISQWQTALAGVQLYTIFVHEFCELLFLPIIMGGCFRELLFLPILLRLHLPGGTLSSTIVTPCGRSVQPGRFCGRDVADIRRFPGTSTGWILSLIFHFLVLLRLLDVFPTDGCVGSIVPNFWSHVRGKTSLLWIVDCAHEVGLVFNHFLLSRSLELVRLLIFLLGSFSPLEVRIVLPGLLESFLPRVDGLFVFDRELNNRPCVAGENIGVVVHESEN